MTTANLDADDRPGTRAFEPDHADRRDLFEYVDRHGPVSPDRARRALGMDRRGFRHHVAILRRDGYLESTDGRLRVATDAGGDERHHDGDVEFTVRPAREADLGGLVGAIRQVAAEQTYIEAETVADVIDHEEVLLRDDAVEARMFFVACVEGEVVGWVHLRSPGVEKLAHTAELTLGVVEEYRGCGIGPRLLDRGMEWARTRGYERLYQSAPATNDVAIGFLEDEGWAVEAVREDHYRIDGEYVDEVMMAVDVDTDPA